MEIGLRRCLIDGENSIDNVWCQLRCEASVELGGQGCARNIEEELAVDFLGELEIVEKLSHSQQGGATMRSRNHTLSASAFAMSKPSVMIRGCKPSEI